MTDGKANLFAALVELQAALPKIAKDKSANIQTKEGKQGPKYDYADLADVSEAILPLLAKVGLAFISMPTMQAGEFGLAYSLVHTSGEREDAFFPLPKAASPQQIGSWITYARRYCLTAVTGVAPDNEDDDAAAAQQTYHRESAGDVFDNATAERPADQGQRQDRPDGQQGLRSVRPEVRQSDPEWIDQIAKQIAEIDTRDKGTRAWTQVVAAHKAGRCTDDDRRAMETRITGRLSDVISAEQESEAPAS